MSQDNEKTEFFTKKNNYDFVIKYGYRDLGFPNTPSYCDSCVSGFSTTHALSYKVGSLIRPRHDESRDT